MPIKYLVNLVGKKLSNTGYSTSHITSPTINGTLKESLIQRDPSFNITLTGNSQFTVEVPNAAYSEMIYTDFYYGYKRIIKLQEEVKKQIQSRTSAWLLVTTYYASFFAAIELTKILGRFNLNLNTIQQEAILNNSTGGCASSFLSSSPVTLVGEAKPSTQYDYVTISFRSSGGRPHKLAWDNLYFYFKALTPANNTEQYLYQRRFIDIIGSNSKSKWPKPSDTRNNWNYSSPKYFIEYGEKCIKQHRAIVGDYKKSFNWASTRKLYPNEENKASSIAFVYTVLTFAIENIKSKILV